MKDAVRIKGGEKKGPQSVAAVDIKIGEWWGMG